MGLGRVEFSASSIEFCGSGDYPCNNSCLLKPLEFTSTFIICHPVDISGTFMGEIPDLLHYLGLWSVKTRTMSAGHLRPEHKNWAKYFWSVLHRYGYRLDHRFWPPGAIFSLVDHENSLPKIAKHFPLA